MSLLLYSHRFQYAMVIGDITIHAVFPYNVKLGILFGISQFD